MKGRCPRNTYLLTTTHILPPSSVPTAEVTWGHTGRMFLDLPARKEKRPFLMETGSLAEPVRSAVLL
jgi:hypothetical protein